MAHIQPNFSMHIFFIKMLLKYSNQKHTFNYHIWFLSSNNRRGNKNKNYFSLSFPPFQTPKEGLREGENCLVLKI